MLKQCVRACPCQLLLKRAMNCSSGSSSDSSSGNCSAAGSRRDMSAFPSLEHNTTSAISGSRGRSAGPLLMAYLQSSA